MAKWSKGLLLKHNMQIKAESKFIRISPRKIRLVADLVRPMALAEALNTLTHLRKRAATPLLKTLKQAQANAVNNHNLNKDSLTIQSIEVNEGSTYKRWQPVSRGRAHSIFKRTSHIRVILDSKPNAKKAKPKIKPETKLKTKKATKGKNGSKS
jgi:large subunit ribosomal protein L22